jgi:hypothetical protein
MLWEDWHPPFDAHPSDAVALKAGAVGLVRSSRGKKSAPGRRCGIVGFGAQIAASAFFLFDRAQRASEVVLGVSQAGSGNSLDFLGIRDFAQCPSRSSCLR